MDIYIYIYHSVLLIIECSLTTVVFYEVQIYLDR